MFHKKVLALLTQPQHYFSICYRCLQSSGIRGNNKRVLSNKVPKFKIYSVDSNGIRSHFEVTKTSLYHELGLTVRDLRFQHVNMIAVRNKKIILRFQNLKAIICTDAVLLVDPPFHNHSGSKSEISTFWNELPSLITGSSLYTSNLPLEYRVLEAVFAYNISSLTATLSQLE
uniref:Magnesium transporter MRS2 homolog, mitochondrial n=2 Tax=Ciona savignyi TaxID=51511 RepID=H2ZF42_CIOSA